MNDKNSKKILSKFKKFLKKKELPDGIQCSDTWFDIVQDMCEKLSADLPSSFLITKIYEKYGRLNVHTKGGNNTTRFIIEAAQEQAENTCVACGKNKELQACDKCKEEPEDAAYVASLAQVLAAPAPAPTQTATYTPPTALSEYYFKLVPDPNQDYFFITPKDYWDTNKKLFDSDLPIEFDLENNGFDRLTDSTFEYTGASVVGQANLVTLGLTENLNM